MRLDQSSVDLATLVAKIKSHEIDLQPGFQRGQVWSDAKKQRLIDTILRQWYVPAIHIVVNDSLDKEEILDGQQRIRSILEFMDDQLRVDGHIEPEDPVILSLDGLRYSELPDQVRSRFRRFALTTVRLREYKPEEPGELFFRLNQLSALTAAEQRNALVGQPRNQIKKLAIVLQDAVGDRKIGFSNARMNYDDVLSRLALALEAGDLREKITAAKLEKRYRSGKRFDPGLVHKIEHSIEVLASVLVESWGGIRFNKATLFSWLFFIADCEWPGTPSYVLALRRYFEIFEAMRSAHVAEIDLDVLRSEHLKDQALQWCAACFNDRSSSRVNDVSSVLLRDLSLNVGIYVVDDDLVARMNSAVRRMDFLALAAEEMRQRKGLADRANLEFELARLWEEKRRETRENR